MKPVVINTQGRNGYDREYCGQIDFRDSARGPWEVMTFLSANPDYQEKLSASMFRHGIYQDYEMDLSEMTSRRFYVMTFKPFRINDRGARRNLLRHLASFKLPIIWKECRHGYRINPAGRIERKWLLKTESVQPNITP